MRVAYISFDFGEYSIRMANSLSRHVEVLLMLPAEEAEPHLGLLDQKVYFHPFTLPRLRHPLRQIKMLSLLRKRLLSFTPDILHLQQGHLWFNLALDWLPVPAFVLTIHDCCPHPGDVPSRKTPQWIFNVGYRRANEIIVHSNYVKQQLVLLFGLPAQHIHVISHIGLGQTGKQNNDHQPPTVLFFGRIWEYKGLEYLIRAEPLITAEVPDARIVIAGQGEVFSRYRKMMVHPDHFVVHNRHISYSDRAELFEQATVVTLPYVEASQSGVIPLAYTHGRPVVGTRVGGIPEMIDDGQTGFCVPPRDEKALAHAVLRILKNPELGRALGANANRKINTECSSSKVASSTVAVYRQAANSSLRQTA
jgi:starch synthase